MLNRVPAALAVLLALTGCASSDELATSDFTGEPVEIVLVGGGFVKLDGERMPTQRCVLLMRRRARGLAPEALADLWVHLQVAEGLGEDTQAEVRPLMDELWLMGIGQIRYP